MSLKTWIHDEDRGVSPVIGVILMVAITVILAAVIAAFVLDMGQSQSQSAQAGVQFSENGDLVKVQIVDEGNTDEINVKISDGSNTDYLNTTNATVGSSVAWSVGDSIEVNSSSVGTSDDIDSSDSLTGNSVESITVIGIVDGKETVIQSWEP